MPFYCNHYKRYGHLEEKCYFKFPELRIQKGKEYVRNKRSEKEGPAHDNGDSSNVRREEQDGQGLEPNCTINSDNNGVVKCLKCYCPIGDSANVEWGMHLKCLVAHPFLLPDKAREVSQPMEGSLINGELDSQPGAVDQSDCNLCLGNPLQLEEGELELVDPDLGLMPTLENHVFLKAFRIMKNHHINCSWNNFVESVSGPSKDADTGNSVEWRDQAALLIGVLNEDVVGSPVGRVGCSPLFVEHLAEHVEPDIPPYLSDHMALQVEMGGFNIQGYEVEDEFKEEGRYLINVNYDMNNMGFKSD